ncbi:metal-dependent transcriptional regulator [Chitinivibrio alkaliphilus]|uniref:Transcriptional regulator MntR n=1 Tax=Chitinivibrio alkaliphilus ACht1 TaxID=1313304 RepID=U7D5I2_9BACT|nr:metal-dependent transcriptional regulator [Chitinivibrio alkaliphilus]ERP31784.1 putative iron-dependent transcriptional regulator [Chitinivibrio alkaliphilus ACht1]
MEETLSSSLEDYLETILELVEENSVARVKDISDRLGVKRSSVTVALRNLSERGLVHYAPYSVITLTSKGDGIAKCISCKHTYLRLFFKELLGLDDAMAEKIACRLEHGFDSSAFIRFRAFIDIVKERFDLTDLHAEIDTAAEGSLEDCLCGGGAPFGEERPHLCALADCQEGDRGVVRSLYLQEGELNMLADMGIVAERQVRVITNDRAAGNITVAGVDTKCTLDYETARHILLAIQ